MFPGFVSSYRDINNNVHLFFYPGLDDNNRPIYKEIDLSECPYKYKEIKFLDNSIDYEFYNKNITKLVCKLVNIKTNNVTFKELITKNQIHNYVSGS